MNSSVLWIFLIVAWLFILLPMVLRGRPGVRKTTAAAENTRLLHRGGTRTAVRQRSAGRHPSNPKYVRTAKVTEPATRDEIEEPDVPENDVPEETADDGFVPVKAGVAEAAAGTEPVGDPESTDVLEAIGEEEDEFAAEAEDAIDQDATDDDLEAEAGDLDDGYDDVDELDEVGAKPMRRTERAVPPREERGRGIYTHEKVAERDAQRYRNRRLISLGLMAATLLAVVGCFFWQPYAYIATAAMLVLSGLYLSFLRKAAVAEQQYRAQRAARLRRHAAEDERLRREQAEQLPVRSAATTRRRPGGMIVLELDDEDPSFDHLPTYDFTYAASAERADDEYRHAG